MGLFLCESGYVEGTQKQRQDEGCECGNQPPGVSRAITNYVGQELTVVDVLDAEYSETEPLQMLGRESFFDAIADGFIGRE